MEEEPAPVIGHWYQDTERAQRLLVVNVDDEHDVIEVQYPDGETGRIDSSAWVHMNLVLTVPPEHVQDADEDDSNEGAMD
jgi:hypothetical protein